MSGGDRDMSPATARDFTDTDAATSGARAVPEERTWSQDRTTAYAQFDLSMHVPTRRDGTWYAGLSPRDVPTAWKAGLMAAGAREVKAARLQRNGHYMTLPLVIQFDCPWDHVDESGERWAKVLLKVDPYTGWVSIHEDSCESCSVEAIERWLITCPRCARGESLDTHADHDDPRWCGPFSITCGDESPIAHVSEAMAVLLERGVNVGDEPTAPRQEWTKESAREWLEALVKDDGSSVVPPTMGQGAAWDAVREIEGRPPQWAVREAQAMRKKDAT